MVDSCEILDVGLDDLESSDGGQETDNDGLDGGSIGSHSSDVEPVKETNHTVYGSSFPNLHPDMDADKILSKFQMLLSVGTKVECYEKVYDLYCEYGHFRGFSVRRSNQKFAGTSRMLKWKEFTCSCAGYPDTKSGRLQLQSYRKRLLRSGCKAKIRVNKNSDGIFSITRFEDNHNHEMVPRDQSYMLRSSRNLCGGKQKFVESMDSLGIGVNISYKFMEKDCGGPQNLGFTRQDAYDHLKRVKRSSKMENADANNLIEYLIGKAYEEPFFFWRVQLDGDGRILNLFFRDARCALDYKSFGDVLSVDTTHRTNKYNLMCCPFVGVNHHTLNLMFGVGFLYDETTITFEWLFRMFLESMGGVEPKLIFTDQSVPMMNAIDKIFPTAKHRLCQWHINKNAPSHFGALNYDETFKKMWFNCMNGVETVAEFEELWKNMTTLYKLHNNSWFTSMYRIRGRWASVFSHGIFSAGLHATSRSEATNRVLKLLVRKNSSLFEFVKNFEEAVASWRTTEVEVDTLGLSNPGQIVDDNPLLIQAAAVFTRSVYKNFEAELVRSFSVVLVDERRDAGGGNVEFMATTAKGSRPRKVLYNVNTDCVSCTCGMMETYGIHCRHVLKVYSVMNVFSIPESQILKRWTKKSRIGTQVSHAHVDPRSNQPYMSFVNDVIRLVYDLAAISIDNSDARKLIRDRVEALHDDVLAIMGKPEEDPKRRQFQTQLGSNPHWDLFRDPPQVKEKGWVVARNKSRRDLKKKKGLKSKNTTKTQGCVDKEITKFPYNATAPPVMDGDVCPSATPK